MRRVRRVLWVLALVTLAVAPAHATSVTVQMTGTWSSVVDNANVLGGTVVVGTSFVATLVYDDATPDTDSDPSVGAYDVPAASSDLSLTTSTFTFTPGSTSVLGIAVDDDNAFGEDVVFLFADAYTASGLPVGISLGGTRYANPVLTDTSGAAHSSDALTGLPWSVGAYDLPSFYFVSGVLGAGAGKLIELQGTISGLAVLPEPSVLAFAMVGLGSLILRQRRG